MTYPFAGVIKMEKIKDEDGNDKVVWRYADDEPRIVMWSGPPTTNWIGYGHGNTEWARIDKDLKLVHLDMDLCAKGPANAYTALAVGIWNAALEYAAQTAEEPYELTNPEACKIADSIRRLKK
jgi:hypothetical protein